MRQAITITAQSGAGTVKLSLKAIVETSNALSRSEAKKIREEWAECLMQTCQGLPYTKIRLHHVRVK